MKRVHEHTSVCFHFTAMLCEVSFRFANVSMHFKNLIEKRKSAFTCIYSWFIYDFSFVHLEHGHV